LRQDEYRLGVRILETRVGIISNRKSLLPALPPLLAVSSLHTDFREVEQIPFPAEADGSIRLIESPAASPRCRTSGTRAVIEGPLAALARRAPDLRYSLWGNLGFLYRFTLFLLEKRHPPATASSSSPEARVAARRSISSAVWNEVWPSSPLRRSTSDGRAGTSVGSWVLSLTMSESEHFAATSRSSWGRI
jgi:hypothetical protein